MPDKITNKKFIQSKSKVHEVENLGNNVYRVTSGTSANKYMVVLNTKGATCNCDWGFYRGWFDPRSGCSHSISAYREQIGEEEKRTLSIWTSQEDADRQHRPQKDIGDGVIITTRKKANGRKSEAQLMKELGF